MTDQDKVTAILNAIQDPTAGPANLSKVMIFGIQNNLPLVPSMELEAIMQLLQLPETN